jgi:hypothetical protein
LELPHILVLIDDPERTVIEPLIAVRDRLSQLYDFDLMLGSGHLSGYFVDDKRLEEGVLAALGRSADPATFALKYGLASDTPVMLFAMGDGNHSLATAKAIWEQVKPRVGMDHPARYALVEIENIHDEGVVFEPIHRVLFDVKEGARSPRSYFSAALNSFYPSQCRFIECADSEDMVALVDSQLPDEHAIGVVSPQGFSVAYIADPPGNLPVGTLQSFLDAWSKTGGFARVDYVHGGDVTVRLGSQPGNLGFYLPAISKSALFKTVIVDGALPRKTFSMGEAKEKRFYMEARRIG